MGSFSASGIWLIVLVVVALVFGGRGKMSGLMGDTAKGIRPSRKA
jgi:sec-independent protein translocase protein TatA